MTLTLHDVQGRVIAAPFNREPMPAGRHRWVWNRQDAAGARVPAGIYFYRFEAGSFAQTRKAVVTD